MINPLEDGKTHLNIYSKGKTLLGQFCTNFAHCPIETKDGHFESVEGYWGWLSISEDNPQREKLRMLYGYQAKKVKEDLYKAGDPGRFDEHFEEKIRDAIHQKFVSEQFKNMLSQMKKDGELGLLKLPVYHYYCYGKGSNAKVIDVTKAYEWFVDAVKEELTSISKELERPNENKVAYGKVPKMPKVNKKQVERE